MLARQLAARGARLVLLARDDRELDRARRLLEEEHRGRRDHDPLRHPPPRRRARGCRAQILEQWGVVDVLINNAGVIQVGPLEHMQHEDFENAMATHFWGPLHLMLELVPSMRRRGFGRIVNIGSIGGRVAVPHLAPYCASKFALIGLSDAVRAELAPYGIRVTTVSPGLMRTGSPMNAQVKGQHEAEYAWFAIADALARIVDRGRARRRSDPDGLRSRRSRADDHAAGPYRGPAQRTCAGRRGARDDAGEPAAAWPGRSGRRSRTDAAGRANRSGPRRWPPRSATGRRYSNNET